MENEGASSEAAGESETAPSSDQQPVVPPSDNVLRLTAGESSGEKQDTDAVERPTDEDIIQHHNRIRSRPAAFAPTDLCCAETKRNKRLPSSAVAKDSAIMNKARDRHRCARTTVDDAEFVDGNEVFLGKLRLLGASYVNARRVRRDGNCFFRSFIFSYVETLLTTRNFAERDRMKAQLLSCKEKMMRAGFQELVFEDALGILQERIDQIGRDLTLTEWELVMSEDHVSSYIIMFLRLLTSAEIQLRRDMFEPYIMVDVATPELSHH